MHRWSLEDLSGVLDDLIVPVNPNQMDSPFPPLQIRAHAVAIDGVAHSTQTFSPHTWSFAGVLHRQSHYLALASWVDQAGRSLLTDHLTRQFVVRLLAFEPVRAGTRQHPWRHTYTVRAVTYEVIA